MKAVSTTLLNFLANTAAAQMMICDLLAITLQDGTVIYLSNFDQDVIWNGQVYSSGSGAITFVRDKTGSKIGTEVAEMNLKLFASQSALIETQPALQFIRNAGLDGAFIRLDRLFMTAYQAPVGVINNFVGRVAVKSVGRTVANLTVTSPMKMIDVQLPKNTYQPTCLHSLYDAGCGLGRASFSVAGTVAAGSSLSTINSSLSNASGYFTQGSIAFTSGANAGQTRTVLSYASGVFVLGLPVFNTPSIGDAFTVYAGCDHTSSTCNSKFNNLVNFRGFEFVPQPETAL